MKEELKEQIISMILEYEKNIGCYVDLNISAYPDLAKQISVLLLGTDLKIENIQIARAGIGGNKRLPMISITMVE